MRLNALHAVAVAATFCLLNTVEFKDGTHEGSLLPGIAIGANKALAQRGPGSVHGTARRTSRRTSRRVSRRNSVAGCAPYRAYYNCGGVYYQPVQEGGTTVYVVVNP